jgi:ABC transport system ATP-binding/permease protein
MGELEPADGAVKIGKRTEFNYADQSRLELDEEKSIFDEVAENKDFMRYGDETISVRGYLKRFLFSDDRIKGKIKHLSGGEKNRVLLAKILKRGGNFLILDEPTNDLDLQSLRVLEEALINFSGTSVIVSHDRYFLDRICDRVIIFEEPGIVSVNEGNYSYYREKRKARATSGSTLSAASKPKAPRPATKEAPPKLKWKEERELETIEETILKAEEKLAEVEAKLADPQFFVENSEAASGMIAGLDDQKAAIQCLYDRWAELEAIRKAWDEWKNDRLEMIS